MIRTLSFAIAMCLVYMAYAARAQSDVCSSINGLVLEGKAHSLSFLGSVPDPLACIVPQIPKFQLSVKDNANSGIARGEYLSLTAAAILLVEQDFANVTRFRELDTVQVALTLADGAGHPDRAVRINSARLFASVVDNSTLCIVLDHLHQPVPLVEGGLGVNTRANLLGVARAAASWISRENQRALAATLDYLKRSISQEGRFDLSNTRALILDIERRLIGNTNGSSPRQELEACLDPELYQYWTPQNYETQRATMNVNPFLPAARPLSLDPEPKEIRYCYQEYRGDTGNDSYLVACHTSADLCEKARVNPNTVSSECAQIDMSEATWTPGTDGLFGSLYQFGQTELPAPFPPVPF